MTAPAVITSDKTTSSGGASSWSRFVPLRESPTDDEPQYDGARLTLVRAGWSAFDDLVRQQNRQVEENVRMLCGLQHSVYHPITGRWIDSTEWMPEAERRWRARPVINVIKPWAIITQARMTENQPIVTFVPGPDRADAELAEILDIAMKTAWFEANMEDVHDRLCSWLLAAGRGHLLTRINPHKGQMRQWTGQGMLPMVDLYDQPISDQDGGQGQYPMQEGVPYGPDGQPRANWRVSDPSDPSRGEMVPTGAPHETPVGAIECDVLAPMQVRGSWGPQPWYQKRRHFIRSFHAPEEVYDMFGIEVEPTVRGGQVSDVGELERLLYGTGFYGAVEGMIDRWGAASNVDGYVELTQLWEAPCARPGMEKTPDQPGGRWLVATPERVLRDGPRPAAFPYTSPLNTFEFVRLAGRPGGSTIQEDLNPIQRAINDDHGRIRDHVALNANPQTMIDAQSGLKPGQRSNMPGQNYVVNRRPGVQAIEHVQPPKLSDDVYKHMEQMVAFFNQIGFTAGANDPGTPGDSGEKVKEVRFNTDRFLGPTMRRMAGEYGRLYENWMAFMPLIWDMETTLHYAGDDNIARTVVIYPELWKEGKCNVRPDVESMLPEGRGEKQEKALTFYGMGLFGDPTLPAAKRKFWEVANMPHLSRFAKPGGVHTTTAEQENGKLVLGTPAQMIPVYEWYDDEAHLAVHENFMASPEFLKIDPQLQDAFAMHRQAHLFNQSQKAAKAAAQMNALAGMGVPGGAAGGGRPGGGGGPPSANGKKPAGDTSGRPIPPTPPTTPVPGGVMPTVAGATAPGLTQ